MLWLEKMLTLQETLYVNIILYVDIIIDIAPWQETDYHLVRVSLNSTAIKYLRSSDLWHLSYVWYVTDEAYKKQD